MICQSCGIEWTGMTPHRLCPRCQKHLTRRSDLVDELPMPSAELEALMVRLKQFGWTPSES